MEKTFSDAETGRCKKELIGEIITALKRKDLNWPP